MASNNNDTEKNSHSSASENGNMLRLKKQTRWFRINSIEEEYTWTVRLKCHNSQDEPVSRPWEIKNDWEGDYLSIYGVDTTHDNRNYVKSFCNADVYVNKWRKACSYQTKLGGPDCCRKFTFDHFANWYDIEKDFKPVSLILIKITVGIEDDMIDVVASLKLDDFMNSTFLSDCVIKTEQKEFPCHKVLLAAKSEYFKTMFSSDMKEANENVIDWKTVFDADTVYDLLYFIYTGKIPSNIDNTCQKLIHAAYLCSMKDLQQICGERLETLINQDNVVEILLIAKKYEIVKLKEVVVKFIVLHQDDIFKTTAWNETNAEVARDMFRAAMAVMRDVMSEKAAEDLSD